MTLKKKLLIALLSTTCVAAGAAGLAACKDDKPKEDPPYTVTAVDQNGNAVKDVVFRMGYYDSANYTVQYVTDSNGKVITATTDKNGKASFKDFTPEEGINYSVYINDQNDRPFPYGYRNVATSVEFDESLKATYEFLYVPSSYHDNYKYAIDYKRTFDDSEYVDGNDETMKYVVLGSDTLTLDLKKDVNTYFSFLSYKELGATGVPNDATESEINEKVNYNQIWGTKAAAGLYNVSFTTASNTEVTMYNFQNTFSFDEDGIPVYKNKQISGKKGTIPLELTVSGYRSRETQNFGIYAATDCTVTVKVERIGDAEEPPEIPTTKAEAPQNLDKYGAQSGTLTLMTIDGSLAFVPGNDGYYHVGSETGPQLLVNLTKTLARVGELSIMDLADPEKNEDLFATGHVFSKYENGKLVAVYDYSEFLKAYAAKTNSDGVYPVDEDLYDFLQLLAAKGQMLTHAGEYTWLVPCQYYMPTDGIISTGAGTQEDPFILLGATNKFDLSTVSGTAYAQFTATTSGVYTFSASNCTVSVNGTKTGFYNEDSLLHVCLGENEKVAFSIEGEGNASVTVGNATSNSVEALFGSETEAEGMTEDSAIQLISTGYTAYTVNNSVNDGVWVYVQPMINGNIDYTFEVKGSPYAQFVYNGTTYKSGDKFSLTCFGGRKYAFFLTAKNGGNIIDGVYALDWQVTEQEPSEPGGEMQLGTNYVNLSASDSSIGVEYTFTSDEGGTFVMTTDSDDAYIFDGVATDYVNGKGSYKFTLEAGGTFTFYCAGPFDLAVSYNVIIEPFEISGDEAFTDNGGTKHIVLDSSNCGNGIIFTFLSTTGGTYTISVPAGSVAMVNIDIESDRDKRSVINTSANLYSSEFTLQAGEYITLIAFAPNYVTSEYDITIAKK